MLNSKKNQGLTLVEIIIALAVLAILASFAYPNFIQLVKNEKLKSFANQVYADIMLARSLAVKHNGAKVEFSNNGYSVKINGDVTYKTVSAPDGIIVSNNFTNNELEFKRNSLPKFNGTISISNGSKTISIIVNLNGGVSFEAN